MASAAHAVLPVPHNKKSKYNYIYRLTDLARKKRAGHLFIFDYRQL